MHPTSSNEQAILPPGVDPSTTPSHRINSPVDSFFLLAPSPSHLKSHVSTPHHQQETPHIAHLRPYSIALLLLSLAAWALMWRTFGLEELGQDGYLSVSLASGSFPALTQFLSRDVHPPLFFVILHWFFQLGGIEYLIAKVLPISANLLALLMLIQLFRRLFNPTIAVISGCLYCIAPTTFLLAPTVRPFTFGLMCSLATLYITSIFPFPQPSRRRILLTLLLTLATTTALLSWYLQIPLLVLECAIALWLLRQTPISADHQLSLQRQAFLLLSAFAVGTLLALPWYLFVLPHLLHKIIVGEAAGGLPPATPNPTAIASGLAEAFTGWTTGPLAWIGTITLTITILIGTLSCLQGSWKACSTSHRQLTRLVLTGGGVITSVTIALILLRWQHPDASRRYMLGLLPFTIGLTSCSLQVQRRWLRSLSAICLCLALLPQLLWDYQLISGTPLRYDNDPESTFLITHLQPTDVILFSDHGRQGQYLMNTHFPFKVPSAVVQTSGDPYLNDSATIAQKTVTTISRQGNRLWWINTQPKGSQPMITANALATRDYFVTSTSAGSSDILLCLTTRPNEQIIQNAQFGRRIVLHTAAYSNHATPGGAISVLLQWQALVPIHSSYHVFVHLINAQGRTVAQHDGIPRQWLAPTNTWNIGTLINDRLGLLLPHNLSPGVYQLHVGLYSYPALQRLTLPNGQNTLTIGTVTVTP